MTTPTLAQLLDAEWVWNGQCYVCPACKQRSARINWDPPVPHKRGCWIAAGIRAHRRQMQRAHKCAPPKRKA